MNPFIRLVVCSCIFCLGAIGCGQKAPNISLHQAVETGNSWAVKQHIAAKSDLNKPDAAGHTALQLAAMKGDLPMVQALVAAGADVKRKGTDGKTAMELARAKGKTAIVQFFQESKPKGTGGRGLIDGGLGVSEAMDSM